jgi:hypothetical protein
LPDGRPALNSVSDQYQETINERLPEEYQFKEPPAQLPAGAGRGEGE